MAVREEDAELAAQMKASAMLNGEVRLTICRGHLREQRDEVERRRLEIAFRKVLLP